MTNPIARPTFYEGEILPAADLGATVDYPRNQMARHARYAHSWGIQTGLNLTFANKTVTLSAGIATDGTGREVVVPADVPLDPTTFDVPLSNASTWYPVFLNGVDQTASPSSSLNGACGGSQSTSMQETYIISFGAPGSELQVSEQTAPTITDGPDGGTSEVWLILLGFVTFDSTNSVFTGTVAVNPGSDIGPQYVGVNASEVVSSSGSLLLATHPPAAPGSNPVIGMELQESATGGQLVFGKLGTNGAIATPAMTISASGDLTLTGQFKSMVKPGSIQVQSGVAFDGMILPLPVGIASTNISTANIYTQVSVHYENLSAPSGLTLPVAFPLQCTVDSSTRLVNCRLRWWDASNWATPFKDAPAPCDYIVIVALAAAS